MVWLGERRGALVDWSTQRWVQLTGRRVVLDDVPWLRGPWGSTHGIGEDFFERLGARRGLTVLPPEPRAGLLPGLGVLRGPGFDPGRVSRVIDEFYAHTAGFDLTIDSRWSGPFRVVGWLIARIFARRLAQMNMPLSARELESCATRSRPKPAPLERGGTSRAASELA